MDVPKQDALKDHGDKDDNKNREQDRLVIKSGNGLWCRANGKEPVERAR